MAAWEIHLRSEEVEPISTSTNLRFHNSTRYTLLYIEALKIPFYPYLKNSNNMVLGVYSYFQ
jgi:hypothetical protein